MRNLILLLLLMGATACNDGKVKGKAPKGNVKTILAIRAGETASHVVIEGTIVDKCPTAGCWFKVQDSSGTIMVDTKAAGFVVTDVPLQKKVKVAGKVHHEQNDASLEATGLSLP